MIYKGFAFDDMQRFALMIYTPCGVIIVLKLSILIIIPER